MKWKAHETLVMLRFAVYLVDTHADIQYRRHIQIAATSVWDFYSVLKGEPMIVSDVALRKCWALMSQCLVRSSWAYVHGVPKFHFSAHLVQRRGDGSNNTHPTGGQ
eukprot:7552471-Pyramimonas_sp.AAC.1